MCRQFKLHDRLHRTQAGSQEETDNPHVPAFGVSAHPPSPPRLPPPQKKNMKHQKQNCTFNILDSEGALSMIY